MLIGSAGGVALALLVVVAVSELGRLFEYGGYLFPWVLAAAAGLVALGAVVGVAFRLSPRYPTLVGVAAGLLILVYTIGRPMGPLTGSHFHLAGFAPVGVFIFGTLLTATVFAIRDQPSPTDHPFSWKRAGLAAALGLLLALVTVEVLGWLLDLHWRARIHLNWSLLPWSVLGLILLGGGFGVLFRAASRTPALGLGALAVLATMIISTPWLWTGGLRLLLPTHGLVAGSPVGLIMVGMLLVAVLPGRRASEHPPVTAPTDTVSAR